MAVFARVGEGTDVVRKEMYTFTDKGERRLALRPEGTASVARAFVEHRPPTPWKVWYAAPSFRYERAQANRYRQHHQLGVEAIGSTDADLDVEVITLLGDFYAALGLRQVDLVLNSIGTPADRVAYIDELRAFLRDRIADLPGRGRGQDRRPPHAGPRLQAARDGRRWWPRLRCSSIRSRPRPARTSIGSRPG